MKHAISFIFFKCSQVKKEKKEKKLYYINDEFYSSRFDYITTGARGENSSSSLGCQLS